jgi:hypothetical protein
MVLDRRCADEILLQVAAVKAALGAVGRFRPFDRSEHSGVATGMIERRRRGGVARGAVLA